MSSPQRAAREAFSSRSVFILAAIGSAVGLGNIWRYPYVAFQAGGGAFLVPYLIALLTAGIPLLFLDYALGHKFRGSPPLAFRRLTRWAEPIGWIQVLMCFVISTYYAVVLAWALRYVFFSATLAWGDDAEGFFVTQFLQQSDETMFGGLVAGVAIPLVLVWIVNIGIVALGIERGIGLANRILLPLLVGLFVLLVVRAVFLPGAGQGLTALYTPDWAALRDPGVWVAAYGQIFFSLSVAFGAMLTYSSHLKRRTNLTGAGLVVAFSNSAFEVLAGIGVFAALGFLALQQGVPVAEAAAGGPGLAFVAFPTLIGEMPFGRVFGVGFFAALVFAGITSLISITQPVAAAFEDKFGLSRRTALVAVGLASALTSLAIFPTTTGLNTLDVTDNWVNNVVLVCEAFAMLVMVVWVARKVPMLRNHLNSVSSFKLGRGWCVCLGVITPLLLLLMGSQSIWTLVTQGYQDLASDLIGVFGWGVSALIVGSAIALTFVPWRNESDLVPERDMTDDDDVEEEVR